MLAENLKKVRLELGLSVAKFADKIKIPAPTLTNYERRERVPSSQLFIQLHNELNVNLNWFVSGQGKMFNSIEPTDDQLADKIRKVLREEGVI